MLDLLTVSDPSLAYIVLGGFAVAFSMGSLLVKERLYINEVVLGTAFGIIIGPHCANVFDPRSWGSDSNKITLEIMRIVLATGLFAIGVELPQSYLADHVKGLLVMVVPTMAFGWVVIAAIIFVLFRPLNYISALVIAACLTPTDPIISAAIIGGRYATKHVPLNLRQILAAESAANDGLAYPFLSLSIYLTTEKTTRSAIGKWFLVGWLYEVILGTVMGVVIGIVFCHVMKFSQRKGFIDRESYVAQYLALAIFTIGVASTIGSDDLLAAFAAGSAISWDGHFNVQIENEVFSTVLDLLLNCACFVYIGAWLPFDAFNSNVLGITPWRLVVLFLAVLTLRRIPPLLLLYKWVPEITTWREALFSGHFGPMGVGAVFVSTLALSRLPEPRNPPQDQAEYLAASIQTIVAFIVLCSIITHGLSIPFFSFGRKMHSRTVSMSRTWTSRNTAPDWLLWARRTPAGVPGVVSATQSHTHTASHSHVDLESAGGTRIDDAQDVKTKVDHKGMTNARVVSPQEALAEQGTANQPLGEAAMLQPVPDDSKIQSQTQPQLPPQAHTLSDDSAQTSSFNRWPHLSMKRTDTHSYSRDASTTPLISEISSPFVSSGRGVPISSRQSTRDSVGVESGSGGEHTRFPIDDEPLPSGAQSPTKIVRFPSSQ